MTIKKTQLIKLRQLNSAIICLSYFLIWLLLKQGHTVGEVIGNCFLYQTELYLITLLPHSSDSGSYPRNDLFRYFSLCTVWWPLSAQIDWHIITLIITKHLPFQNQKIKYCFLVCQICKMKYYYKYILDLKITQIHQIAHTFSADLMTKKSSCYWHLQKFPALRAWKCIVNLLGKKAIIAIMFYSKRDISDMTSYQ